MTLFRPYQPIPYPTKPVWVFGIDAGCAGEASMLGLRPAMN